MVYGIKNLLSVVVPALSDTRPSVKVYALPSMDLASPSLLTCTSQHSESYVEVPAVSSIDFESSLLLLHSCSSQHTQTDHVFSKNF